MMMDEVYFDKKIQACVWFVPVFMRMLLYIGAATPAV